MATTSIESRLAKEIESIDPALRTEIAEQAEQLRSTLAKALPRSRGKSQLERLHDGVRYLRDLMAID